MNDKAIVKSATAERQALTVYDEDKKELVQISPEKQERAWFVLKKFDESRLVSALYLKLIQDEKLYLVYGCTSMNDFGDRKYEYSRQYMYKLLKGAKRFVSRFPQLMELVGGDQKMLASGQPRSPDKSKNNNKNDFLNEWISDNFSDLSKLEEAEFEVLTSDKNLKDAGALTRALSEMKSKHNEERRKFQARIAQQDEEIKKIDLEQLLSVKGQRALDEAEELQRLYGATGGTVAAKRMIMDKSREYLYLSEQLFHRMKVTDEDPVGLQKDVADLIKRFHVAFKRMLNNYLFLMDNIEEYD